MNSTVSIHWPADDDARYMPIITAMTEPLSRLTHELNALGMEAQVGITVSCSITIESPAGPTPAYIADEPAAADAGDQPATTTRRKRRSAHATL